MVYSDHITRWPNNTHDTRCLFHLPHSMLYHSKDFCNLALTATADWPSSKQCYNDPSSLGHHILDFLISVSSVVSEGPTTTLIIVFMVSGTHVFFSFLLLLHQEFLTGQHLCQSWFRHFQCSCSLTDSSYLGWSGPHFQQERLFKEYILISYKKSHCHFSLS